MKYVKEMTEVEKAETLAELRKGPTPPPIEPMDMTKKAAEMSEVERAEWLREHIRRSRG